MLIPESCVSTRKGAGEALTGARAGQVLSRETKLSPGGRRFPRIRKATWSPSISREWLRPRVVVDPVHVRKLLTREPGDPVSDLGKSRVRAVNPKGARQRCTESGSRTG